MVTVAWIAHAIVPALPWAAAFALGAIVSPPDAIAATAIIRRLGVPHRIQAILEGESLVNDATALVALQFAVAALVTGTFSPGYAAVRFVWAAAAGIGFGLLVGVVMRWVQSHLDDPPIQITISLLTPFVAYLPAERLHASGVLATVCRRDLSRLASPLMISARTRLQAYAFWETVMFLLNGFVFIVIGLQLPGILHTLNRESLTGAVVSAIIICAPLILVRFAWVIPAAYLPPLRGRLAFGEALRPARQFCRSRRPPCRHRRPLFPAPWRAARRRGGRGSTPRAAVPPPPPLRSARPEIFPTPAPAADSFLPNLWSL